MSAAYQERERLFAQVDEKLLEAKRLTRGWRGFVPWNLWRTFRLLRESESLQARIRELLP